MRVFVATFVVVSSFLVAGPVQAESATKLALVVGAGMGDDDVLKIVLGSLRDAGYRGEDATDAIAPMLGLGSVMLGAVDAKVPPSWPTELHALWNGTMAACRAEAGPPPYNPRNAGAHLCGRRVAPALLQRYLAHRKADAVLEVEYDTLKGGNIRIHIAFYERDSTNRFVGKATVPKGKVDDTLRNLVARAVAGEGDVETRAIRDDLPKPPDVIEAPKYTLDESSIRPVRRLRKPCAARLPSAVEVESSTSLVAQAVPLVWAATLKKHELDATGAAWKCTLTLSGPDPLQVGPGMTMYSVGGTLTCGKKSVEATTMHITPEGGAAAVSLAVGLAKSILKRECS